MVLLLSLTVATGHSTSNSNEKLTSALPPRRTALGFNTILGALYVVSYEAPSESMSARPRMCTS